MRAELRVADKIYVKNNVALTLRWAQVTDADNIARLELSSAHFEHRAHPFTFTHPQFAKLWETRIKGDELKTMLACGAKSIYGFLTFKNDIKFGQILALYIDPLYMHYGIGTVLMQTAEHMVKQQGGRSMQVDVEVLNEGGIAFYEKLGFVKTVMKLDHLIVMKKEIGND